MGHRMGIRDREKQRLGKECGKEQEKKNRNAHRPEGMMGLLVVCEPDETF